MKSQQPGINKMQMDTPKSNMGPAMKSQLNTHSSSMSNYFVASPISSMTNMTNMTIDPTSMLSTSMASADVNMFEDNISAVLGSEVSDHSDLVRQMYGGKGKQYY